MDETLKDKRKFYTLRSLLGKSICRALRYQAPVADPACGPMLVVSNHNTDFDPVFLGMSFKEHMYFVASEHIFRWGFISKALIWLFHPIARKKGTTDAMAAMQIMRTLRRGNNVCLFAEGNRSFNGVTGHAFSATGKLARSAKAALVTYRLKGGYLSTPRWSVTRRKGKITGEVVHIYTNEQLKQMTDEEIEQAISRDIYEDAFERQSKDMQPYRGKRLAEGLENALYICPDCGAVGTLKGEGDLFSCNCGLHIRYNEYGFFQGQDVPFTNVRDWDIWQSERLRKIVEESMHTPDETLFSNENIRLLRISDDHGMTVVAEGTLSVCGNAISVGDTVIPLKFISDMAIVGRTNIVFSSAEASYEIRSAKKQHWCGRKYLNFYTVYKELSDSK